MAAYRSDTDTHSKALDELKNNNLTLPRCERNPDKKAITYDIGIDRSVFYDHKKFIKIMNP